MEKNITFTRAVIVTKVASIYNRLFYYKYLTYLALGNNLIVFVKVTCINNEHIFKYLPRLTLIACRKQRLTSVHTLAREVLWIKVRTDLNLGRNRVHLGTKWPWARNTELNTLVSKAKKAKWCLCCIKFPCFKGVVD